MFASRSSQTNNDRAKKPHLKYNRSTVHHGVNLGRSNDDGHGQGGAWPLGQKSADKNQRTLLKPITGERKQTREQQRQKHYNAADFRDRARRYRVNYNRRA